ncbi:MAG TPA: Gmad2 immunoglobulin-like domain-containing protein [Candidatus Paceibacterota bacterium]|nr:Gmad2 immunoglobulin-like domain-containing protein [Candidatus Paceibacterota bacterium]
MSNQTKFIIFLVIAAIVVYGFFAFDIPYRNTDIDEVPSTVPSTTSTSSAMAPRVSVDSLTSGAAIASPVSLSGKAVGPWYFEASFPIQIVDIAGKVLGQGHAEAQGDWMVEGLVPWKATVAFTRGTSTQGFIRLEKDNPSGDPARDEHVDVPVAFQK